MSECSCCFEDFSSKRGQSPVPCQFCDFTACQTCQKTYTLGIPTEPHCMNCKKEWSTDHLFSYFPKTFINKDLKHHRETILSGHQKSLLPTTQDAVQLYKVGQKLVENIGDEVKKYEGFNRQINDNKPMIDRLHRTERILVSIESFKDNQFIKDVVMCLFDREEKNKKIENPRYRPDYFTSGDIDKQVDKYKTDCVVADTILKGNISAVMIEAIGEFDRLKLMHSYDDMMDIVKIFTAMKRQYGWMKYNRVNCVSYSVTLLSWAKGEISFAEAYDYVTEDLIEVNRQVDDIRRQRGYDMHPRDVMNTFIHAPELYLANRIKGKTAAHQWTWACPCDECKGFLDDKNTCGTCDKEIL